MLTPIQSRLNPVQIKISHQISKAVPALPTVISDLIATYVSNEDLFQLAQNTELLKPASSDPDFEELHGCGIEKFIETPGNHEFGRAVQFCLSTAGCPPIVKRMIFEKIQALPHNEFWGVDSYNTPYYKPEMRPGIPIPEFGVLVLNYLLDAMRKTSTLINLNGVDLSSLQLSGVNLDFATAVGANFNSSELLGATFRHADLTGANFSDAQMMSAILDEALLCHATLDRALLSNSSMRFSNVTGARFNCTVLSYGDRVQTDLTGLITSNAWLAKRLRGYRNYFSNEVLVTGRVVLSSSIEEVNGCTVG